MKWKLCIATAFLAGLSTALFVTYPKVEIALLSLAIGTGFIWLIGDSLRN
jgi:hypothetical protein